MEEEEIPFNIMLKEYYNKCFPYDEFFQWLSYGKDNNEVIPQNYFRRREFSFTLDGDIYCRYQSFQNQKELKTALTSQVPIKIDIGCVFNANPNHKTDLIPQEKEFVIDIDMTDYDPVRTCCSEAHICQKCWKFIKLAGLILDESLKQDFGFKHILWAYSGRRGIHLWVCDEKARKMTDKVRCSVIEYLNIIQGNEFQNSLLKSTVKAGNSWHPSVQRAIDIMTNKKQIKKQINFFQEIILNDQDLINKRPQIFEGIIKHYFEDKSAALWECIQEEWNKMKTATSKQKWDALLNVLQEKEKELLTKFSQKIVQFQDEVILSLLYPRLDINVSKTINHLLKSPFCVHPKTGNVCVPFTIEQIEQFDPFQAPNLKQIYELIKRNCDPKVELQKYLAILQEFIRKCMNDSK